MVKWELLNDEVALRVWDVALLQLDDYSPCQTYAWGEYRRALGWEICRWAAFNDQGDIVAMMLGLLRRYPLKLGLVWSEGGPVGDLSVCDEGMQEAIKKTTGLHRIYCRFRCDRERNIEDVLLLNAQGWCRSWFTLTSNYSMTLDITQDEKHLLATCERNWRRNLRQAGESNLTVREWTDPNVDEVLSIYTSMQSVKGLDEQHSREEIEQVLKTLKQQLVLYRCDDERGELVSLLGWQVLGKRAWGLFSATSEQGRKVHASYALYWALVRHCRSIDVESCDLAGIDPRRNRGVYRFKRATGATPLEYLGEWDWATSQWLRWCGNWAISRREKLKQAESAFKSSAAGRLKSSSGNAVPAQHASQSIEKRCSTTEVTAVEAV